MFDREKLRDIRQLLAFVALHWIAIPFSPHAGNGPTGTQTGLGQFRADNRRTQPIGHITGESFDLLCRFMFIGKTGHIPDTTALQARVESRHPKIREITDSAPGYSHRRIDHPVMLQFLAECRYKTLD